MRFRRMRAIRDMRADDIANFAGLEASIREKILKHLIPDTSVDVRFQRLYPAVSLRKQFCPSPNMRGGSTANTEERLPSPQNRPEWGRMPHSLLAFERGRVRCPLIDRALAVFIDAPHHRLFPRANR